MPVRRNAYRRGRFWFEVWIARVTVTVAEPCYGADGIRAPRIALIEVRRAVLASHTQAVTLPIVGLVAGQQSCVDIDVGARAMRRVEGLRGRIDAVIALHRTRVHPNRVVSHTDERDPVTSPPPFPFRKAAQLHAGPAVDADVVELRTDWCTRPAVIQSLAMQLIAEPQRVSR